MPRRGLGGDGRPQAKEGRVADVLWLALVVVLVLLTLGLIRLCDRTEDRP